MFNKKFNLFNFKITTYKILKLIFLWGLFYKINILLFKFKIFIFIFLKNLNYKLIKVLKYTSIQFNLNFLILITKDLNIISNIKSFILNLRGKILFKLYF